MPTTYLKLTPLELKDYVNPTDDPENFQFGTGQGLMSESKALDLLQAEEGSGLSRSPEDYRRILMGTSRGEILTDPDYGAKGGETTLQLAFYPVRSGSLVLYKNFSTDHNQPWKSRKRQYALEIDTDYTINETTGAITLVEALDEADTVVADYNHDGSQRILSFRNLILKAARVELYDRFPTWAGDSVNTATMRDSIDDQFFQFGASPISKGVSEIDNVAYLRETRPDQSKGVKLAFMRGPI